MSGQDYPDHSKEAADSSVTQMLQAPTSRRSMLRRSAFAGAIGLAVAAGGGGAAATLLSSQSKAGASQSGTDASSSGPIVIYMADPQSGEMDIYAGTGKTHTRNQSVASLVTSMAPH